MNRRGFTILETVSSLLIIGILVNIAIPNYIKAKKSAEAANIIQEMDIIKKAVLMYYSDNNEWPPDTWWGVIPKELKPYLPNSIDFDKNPVLDVKYSLDNYIGNTDFQKKYGLFDVAVSVHSTDAALINSLKNISTGNLISSKGFFNNKRLYLIIKSVEN